MGEADQGEGCHSDILLTTHQTWKKSWKGNVSPFLKSKDNGVVSFASPSAWTGIGDMPST